MSSHEAQHSWLEQLFYAVPNAVIVTDGQGRTLWVNTAFERLTGYGLEALRDKTPGSILQGPGTSAETVALMRQRIRNGQPFRTTVLNFTQAGHPRNLLLDVQPVGPSGQPPTHFVGFESHVTDDSQSIRLAMSSARQGIWHWDASSRAFRVADEFLALLGIHHGLDQNISQFNELIFSEDRHQVRGWFRSIMRGVIDENGITFRIRGPSGQIYWIEARGRGVLADENGRFISAAGVLRDITQAKASERAMEHLAYYDALTGLPNRRTLDDQIVPALASAKQTEQKTAVLFIDLDGFKQINDLFGHAFGDSVLCTVAQRLQAKVRPQDLVGRVSGDEFLIMMNGFDSRDDPSALAERLVEAVREPIVVLGQELLVGASIGISVFPDDGDDGERLVRLADLAMYEVKQSGRNGYRFFEQAMNDNAARLLKVESRLRQAVKAGELDVHFQPLVDAEHGVMIGAEALARWTDGELGTIPPDQFIPVAERLGLIHMLGEWVLESACSMLHRYQRLLGPDFFVSVNVSPIQLGDPGYLTRVRSVLEHTGIAANRIQLEVTESALMRDPVRALKKLEQLKEIGFGLAIDDFGTGYSSLSALRDLPIDKLKIDRSFVNDIRASDRTRSIVEAIIDIARRLSLCVNAEGVEDAWQADYLFRAGCHECQGYYFGKPMKASELVELVGFSLGNAQDRSRRRHVRHWSEYASINTPTLPRRADPVNDASVMAPPANAAGESVPKRHSGSAGDAERASDGLVEGRASSHHPAKTEKSEKPAAARPDQGSGSVFELF